MSRFTATIIKLPKLRSARYLFSKISIDIGRKLTPKVNKLKIETSISLELRDEEVEIYGKPNCWDIG